MSWGKSSASGVHGRASGFGVLQNQGGNNFNPAAISGYYADYDASQLTGYADGANVPTFTDVGPNGLHATNATTAQQPVYKASVAALNGQPALQFSGGQILITSQNISLTTQVTAFLVFYPTGTNQMVIFETGTGGQSGAFSFFRNNGSPTYNWFTSGGGTPQFTTSDERGDQSGAAFPNIFCATLDRTQTNGAVSVYTNAYPWGSITSNGNPTGNFTAYQLRIGSRNGLSLPASGYIARLIIYNKVLSTTERQQVTDYLYLKYLGYAYDLITGLVDNVYPVNSTYFKNHYYLQSTFARKIFNTTATSVSVDVFSDTLNTADYRSSITIKVNGTEYASQRIPFVNYSRLTFSLPAGSKTVEILSGIQAVNNGVKPIQGLFIRQAIFNAPATVYSPTSNGQTMFIWGDSISTGFNANPPATKNWTSLLRANYPGEIINDCYSGRTFYDDAKDTASKTSWVSFVQGVNPNIMLVFVGVNDYILNKWDAPTFGTAWGDMLDRLHTALPSTTMYFISSIVKGSEVANGSGNTLDDYRNQLQTACSTRAWANFVNGKPVLTTSDLDTDQLHPTTSGHNKFYLYIKGLLGL